jgi:diguanylate cyclase (GGDEF)-like protein
MQNSKEVLVTQELNRLVTCFVDLSASKERYTLEQSMVKSLCQLLQCSTVLVRLYNGHGEYEPHAIFRGDATGACYHQDQSSVLDCDLLLQLKRYLEVLHKQPTKNIYELENCIFWPLFSGSECIDVLILSNDQMTAPKVDLVLLNAMSSFFTNFISLVNACERDALTGLYNRRIFDTRLCSLVRNTTNSLGDTLERRKAEHDPYNFLGIIDIDYFKRVNDEFGHLFGDEVLLWLAQNMRHCFRNEDALFRYGGEEFAVLLTGLSQVEALEVFERFRKI